MKNKRRIGEIIKLRTGDESYSAYVPRPLPPVPPLALEPLYPLLDKANLALGRLDGMSATIPNASLFLYMYIRKEAVLSSQIEGTQSSLSDLLTYELEDWPGAPVNDVEEVSNYVAAMSHALKRLKDLPLSLRLIREMHAILLSRGRGQRMNPGQFRTSQNWIGGTRPRNTSRQRRLCASAARPVDRVPGGF
jgi:Fic family protein